MRFSLLSTLVVALAADATVASSWFGKTVYNKWHETELERWLSDHDIPYPTPADRKDLENLVKDNWNDNVYEPYKSWDTNRLQSYLSSKGKQAKKNAEKGAAHGEKTLVDQVKSAWYESENQANDAYANVRDWVFDSWTNSQLKSFLDRNGIPAPQPRTRDSLLKTVRENYQSAANKLGQSTAYPGNWLYESWSESDLKRWLDERGYPVPQPTSRDKLVANVRRNARLASESMRAATASASTSAAEAQHSLTDALVDAYNDEQLTKWVSGKNIKVPQGIQRKDLEKLARNNRDKLASATASAASSASSYYGAATSSAGNQYAQATGGIWAAIDWVKQQVGLAASDVSASATSVSRSASSAASASGKSASDAAAKSASSASAAGSKSASSASVAGSKSASSAASAASKSASKAGQKAADAAKESATSGKNRVGEAAQKATDYVKEEL